MEFGNVIRSEASWRGSRANGLPREPERTSGSASPYRLRPRTRFPAYQSRWSSGTSSDRRLPGEVPALTGSRENRSELLDPLPHIDFAHVHVSPRINPDGVRERHQIGGFLERFPR